MAAVGNTWIRRALDIAKLPRVKLDNIQDLPGAKKKVSTSPFFSVSSASETPASRHREGLNTLLAV